MGALDLKASSNSESKTKALPSSAVFELSQEFYFEAAHTLEREFEAEGSRRIHGHTYSARISIAGSPCPIDGMVIDLASLRIEVGRIRAMLDHRFLDEIEGLYPVTLENICLFVFQRFKYPKQLSKIEIWRTMSGDKCVLNLRHIPDSAV